MTETPPPKLFTHKPTKAQIKKNQGNVAKDFSPPPSAPPAAPTPPAHTPAALVNESFARRYKFLWPLLLTVNLTVGAYIFMRTKNKDTSGEGESDIPLAAAATDSVPTAAPVAENSGSPDVASSHPLASKVSAGSEHTTVSEVTSTHLFEAMAVPEERQRELFKWILNEKRKIKPKDAEEKKCIDADKAVLKQYIRDKSIPSI